MKPLPSVQPPLFELGPYVADEVGEVTDLCVVFRADSEHGPVALHIPRASLQGDLEFRALWSSALDGADGQVGGRSSVLWRAAPWVEGRTLSTLLRRLRSRGGRLGLQDSLAIGVEIARQLDAIHQAGSWHGRLDADRVLIGVDGAVHLLGHPAPALFCSVLFCSALLRCSPSARSSRWRGCPRNRSTWPAVGGPRTSTAWRCWCSSWSPGRTRWSVRRSPGRNGQCSKGSSGSMSTALTRTC